jgi:hypothetical protein
MPAKACACAVVGLEGALIEVEVDIGQGLPAFSIVGLPDAAVNEAKERVRAAIKNSGGIFPMRRTTPPAMPDSSAADAGHVPARSRWRIAVCSSSTNCRSSARTRWRSCASRWRIAS